MVVPAAVNVSRTTFCHDDTHTDSLKVITIPAVAAAAGNYTCRQTSQALRLKTVLRIRWCISLSRYVRCSPAVERRAYCMYSNTTPDKMS